MSIIEEYEKQISELYAKIQAIQNECSHPKAGLKETRKGDSGNYDPTQDRYWTEYNCGLCKKHWVVDDGK